MHQPIKSFSLQGVYRPAKDAQHGVSLIMVMLIMVVVSMLGIGGVQIAMMAERGARNDRDMQVAFQAAEAALLDAEFDINNKNASSKRTVNPFDKNSPANLFLADCAGTGDSLGLCTENIGNTSPAWLKVDFTDTSTAAKTVEFGKFTGRAFPVGAAGIQPYQKPRYVIERLERSFGADGSGVQNTVIFFRITAMGFGPRQDLQVVLQSIYRN